MFTDLAVVLSFGVASFVYGGLSNLVEKFSKAYPEEVYK